MADPLIGINLCLSLSSPPGALAPIHPYALSALVRFSTSFATCSSVPFTPVPLSPLARVQPRLNFAYWHWQPPLYPSCCGAVWEAGRGTQGGTGNLG